MVYDCYKKDNGTTDTNIWNTANATLDRNVNNEYSVLTETTTGTTGICAISSIPLTDYHVEVDIFQVDGTQGEQVIEILGADYSYIDAVNGIVGEWKHITLDKHNLNSNTRVRIKTGASCTELRFKNFKMYPI